MSTFGVVRFREPFLFLFAGREVRLPSRRRALLARSAGNVQAALKRHGIAYPVAQDNDSATWNAWRNQYWPAQYIVDQHGNIVFSHAGEGQYDEIERTVRRLLNATS